MEMARKCAGTTSKNPGSVWGARASALAGPRLRGWRRQQPVEYRRMWVAAGRHLPAYALDHLCEILAHDQLFSIDESEHGVRRGLGGFDKVAVQDDGLAVEPCQFDHGRKTPSLKLSATGSES